MEKSDVVLVTGATGAQGGAVVDALLDAGRAVRALVRDPASAPARALSERGVQLCEGDFDDVRSIRAAVDGVHGVFSMQMPVHAADLHSETRAAVNLVQAAAAANVEMFVHTSVARAGDHTAFTGWNAGRWWAPYWTSKAAANDVVRSGSLAHWVILKPAFMMDNFVPPKSHKIFPQLSGGAIVTAMAPESRLDLIAAEDIGRMAAAAFDDPARFDRREFDLAAESLTMTEIAATLTAVTGTAVRARHRELDAVVASGTPAGVAENQEWVSAEGYRVDLGRARQYGIDLRSFADWALARRDDFELGDARRNRPDTFG